MDENTEKKTKMEIELIIDEDIKHSREGKPVAEILLVNELAALRNIEILRQKKLKVENYFSVINFGANIDGENRLLVGMFKKGSITNKEAMMIGLNGDYEDSRVLIFNWQSDWIEGLIG